jgi:hypothetical protein
VKFYLENLSRMYISGMRGEKRKKKGERGNKREKG